MASSIERSHTVKKLNRLAGLAVCMALTASAHAGDPVLASFTRMLQHQPAWAAALPASAREPDAVLAGINRATRNDRRLAERDALVASFERMLNHRPAPAGAYRVVTRDPDRVQDMINVALRAPRLAPRGGLNNLAALDLAR